MGDAKRRRAILGDEAYFRGDDKWGDMKLWRQFCQVLGVISSLSRHPSTQKLP